MLFGFNTTYFRRSCVHFPQENFTNALFLEDCRNFQLALLQTNNNHSQKSWEEIKKSPHCRYLENDNDYKRIGKYLGLTKKEIDKLINNEFVYQIPLGEDEKFRAYGILKVLGNKHYFEFLLFDPNHLFYLNPEKNEYPYGSGAVCLMSKENCSGINEKPKDKKLIRKSN